MKNVLLLFFLIGLFNVSCKKHENSIRELSMTTDFNADWKFKLTDSLSTNGEWRSVQLPHDWSVEASFDSINGEGATGYLPGGIGYYKKNFSLSLEDDQTVYLLFDGVYNNATVSLNGKELGFHPYGYSPFYYGISSHLNANNDSNLLKVKVDRTRFVDSRWYTGSGIYRNVKMVVKNKLHIPIWGTFITTPNVNSGEAKVAVEIKVKNDFDEDQQIDLLTEIFNPDGQKVAQFSSNVMVAANSVTNASHLLEVNNPLLWDLETPRLYKAINTITKNGEPIDQYETSFGIRTIRFDANEGFFLNGKNRKIKGVCLHHDAGLVGAAVPKGVWKRRLQKLKEGGCNAIRISHNPGSQEFLELCDEMGFLVQDEFFDEWDNPKDKRKNMNEQSVDYVTRGYAEHFQEWAEKDLKNVMLAHRNHPSIIQWSIGNEIEWTYPRNGDATGFFNNMHWSGNYFWETPPNTPEQIKEQLKVLPRGKYDIGKTAQNLANWTRELDTTRYVIANCILPSSSYESGYIDALDMVGFSYRRVLYDYGHKNYADKPIMGTENLGQWHEWKAVMERPFISGTYLWTGIDYMGEANEGWPGKGSSSGLLDLAGFEKPAFHMFRALWNETPQIHIATQIGAKSIFKENTLGKVVEKTPDAWKQALWGWHDVNAHWNYKADELIIAELYTNCEEVELFLNEKSLGIKKLTEFEDHIYKWAVPHKEGVLMAKGKKDGKTIETQLVTTSAPTSISLTVDKTSLDADGYDVAHVVAQLVDTNGNPVKTEDRTISFQIDGEVKVLGVDNGARDNVQDFQAKQIVTNKGRCLLIVQSKTKVAEIKVNAISDNLKSNTILINTK